MFDNQGFLFCFGIEVGHFTGNGNGSGVKLYIC